MNSHGSKLLRQAPQARLLSSAPIRQSMSVNSAYAFQLQARGLFWSNVTRKASIGSRAKKTSVKLSELPQGLLGDDELPVEPVEELGSSVTYPTVIQQARENMNRFPGCVVLTRVGGFYELYFHQAEHWSQTLNIKLAYKRTSVGSVPMAGWPVSQLERYLKALVQDHGMHVAIAEEVANDPSQKVKSGGLMFDRQIQRIVTPGTLIDESFLLPNKHNYLLGITMEYSELGENRVTNDKNSNFDQSQKNPQFLYLSWIDLSSGDFVTQVVETENISSSISRIDPGEIVVDSALQQASNVHIKTALAEFSEKLTIFETDDASMDSDLLNSMLERSGASSSHPKMCFSELASVKMLLGYVRKHLPLLNLQLQAPRRYESRDHLSIDKNTRRGLEILKRLRDGNFEGSLLHAVRRTKTQSGARLLSERLIAPSTSPSVIESRLDLVQSLVFEPELLSNMAALLSKATDSLRLVQAFACGKGGAQDLLSLAGTIILTRKIGHELSKYCGTNQPLQMLLDRFEWDRPLRLASRIHNAIDEEGLAARSRSEEEEAAEAAGIARAAIAAEGDANSAALQKKLSSAKLTKRASDRDVESDEVGEPDKVDEEFWIMRKDASQSLRALHDRLNELKEKQQRMSENLRMRLNAKSLELRWSASLGHFIHVKGKDARHDPSKILPETRMVGSSKSTKSFLHHDWTALGHDIDTAKARIRAEEQRIFRSLRDEVCNDIVVLRNNANILDELDVACSSAALANECNLVRPILDESKELQIVDGRHMTVEAGLQRQGRSFTPNDCTLGTLVDPKPTSPASDATSQQRPPNPIRESIHLITGPNMAGKSTYLRQTALIFILAQTGLYVPASYARLGLVDAVFSRIGSADNLYQDQSTFMVEMLETAEILRNAGPRSLVVMDEVGRGTSPEDGVAVGYAVLETLRRKGVGRVIFATHFLRLVELCRDWREVGCFCTRVVEEGGKGSFRFDHKIRRGVNSDSHALKVAQLAGVPEETVQIASDILRTRGSCEGE